MEIEYYAVSMLASVNIGKGAVGIYFYQALCTCVKLYYHQPESMHLQH